ncbi:MAG: alpha/beta fold hydrolase [Theionarchaea archaeon]|nr:alpha/beta fold hydrolase [Theionarchaea archaeon]
MNFDPIADDPVPDETYPATLAPVTFKSKGEQIIGVTLQAQGEGPHPTVVLLHGFPGNERNFDLAHIFRRAGWNVLVFHYRGSWGSQGSFSFTHVLEDVLSAVTFLRSKNTCELYHVNPQEIVLIGHSMGGFAALMTAANDPHIHAAASIAGFNMGYFVQNTVADDQALEVVTQFFEEGLPPLQGTSAEKLIQEAVSNAEPWNLLNYTEQLSSHSLLLIGGSRDETAPIEMHHQPLVQALEHAQTLTHAILDADHSFSDKRVTLARKILSWLESL